MVKHVSELISCQSKVAEKGLSWNQTTPLDDDGCLSECMGVASEDAVGESLRRGGGDGRKAAGMD